MKKKIALTQKQQLFALGVVCVAATIAILCCLGVHKQIPQAMANVTGLVQKAFAEPDYGYYNEEVQNDGIAGNENNFGGDKYPEVADKANAVLEGKNLFYSVITRDPAIAAADIYETQISTGVNVLNSSINNIADANSEINALHKAFRDDENYWRKTAVEQTKRLLDTYTVSIETLTGYESQMFMLPHSASFDANAPSIIFQRTEHAGGHVLVFTSPDGTKVVKFRFECCFQPCADRYLAANPQAVYVPPVTPTSDEPSYTKDSTQDSVYQGNAEGGGGYNYVFDDDGNPIGIDWSPGEDQPVRPIWRPTEPVNPTPSPTPTPKPNPTPGGGSRDNPPPADPIPTHEDSHGHAGDDKGEAPKPH